MKFWCLQISQKANQILDIFLPYEARADLKTPKFHSEINWPLECNWFNFKSSCVRTIGRHCEKNINECLGNPCINGICIDSLNGYDCECHPGFFGLNCDSQIKPCPTEHNRGSLAGPTKMESTNIDLQTCTISSPTSILDNYLQLGMYQWQHV